MHGLLDILQYCCRFSNYLQENGKLKCYSKAPLKIPLRDFKGSMLNPLLSE